MSEQVSRRDFLKLAGLGAATTAVLTGCGPASRYVTREPYQQMPEYNLVGHSTYYATTCRECAAACGIVVRTYQGRAIKVEGNANHPLNLGKTCARGQTSLQGLYNPDRVTDPIKRSVRGDVASETMNWDDALQVVTDALKNHKPSEIAFLLGTSADHLFDLVTDLANSTGVNAPVRFGALSMFEARATLSKAAENLFGQAGLPWFDIANAQAVFSFGANFLETWISPVSYTRGFSNLRKAEGLKPRGQFVQFESRMSATGARADEWVPLRPGTEALVALAIGKLVAEHHGMEVPKIFSGVDPAEVAEQADIELEALEHIAKMFAEAKSIAVPGGAALGQSNGLAVAEAVLALNVLADNIGKAGGVYLSPLAPTETEYQRPASIQEMKALIEKMNAGEIKVLFVHGGNPVFELPLALNIRGALGNVEQVISFATFPDETALESDYVFPDHHFLEGWGYQRVATGVNLPVLSGAQPVVSPLYNTRSTVDVLLTASQAAFGNALPFKDEVEFLHSKVIALMGEAGGSFSATDEESFMASFQQYGGWWKKSNGTTSASDSNVLDKTANAEVAEFAGEGEFFLVPFVSPTLGEAGANKPWLQELADSTTTVMWNTWVEMNPETAHHQGIHNDDLIKIISEAGEIEVPVYLYPAIRPDTIAIPFGQGHIAYGRYATTTDENGNVLQRGANPADLLSIHFNEAGDLAFAGMKVRIEKTGRTKPLSRLESRIGVYNEGMEGH
ncbi:MAG: molybdopterin oxidoreductase, large subunit [Chloroflexi bacterium OLB14]|nr:MAG: molybdopterin oxidoreductase, large subunit [Chloroflexi bacterium OLB14]